MTSRAVALGLRSHSGWAALVAVAGTLRSPEILLRQRIELSDPKFPVSKQPYHAAEGEKLPKAEKIIARCAADALALAGKAFDEILAGLSKEQRTVAACGLLLASGRALPGLEAILASHALIHTADGELFRDALTASAAKRRLPVTKVKEKEVSSLAVARLGISEEEIAQSLKAAGRLVGPPWTQDQKLAALVAWIALAS